MMKKLVGIIDGIFALCVMSIFAAVSFFIISAGKRVRAAKKTDNVLRFFASNLEAIRKQEITAFMENARVDGIFRNVTVVCLPNTFSEEGEMTKSGVQIIQYSQHPDTFLERRGFRKTNACINEFRIISKIIGIVKSRNIDLMIAQDPHFMGLNALLASRIAGVPYIVHVITNYDVKDRLVRKLAFPPFLFLRFELAVEKMVFKNAAFVTASYSNYKDYALTHGSDPARTFALKTTVDPVHFGNPEQRKDIRKELGVSSDAKILLFVGRLAGVKFPTDLIECARELAGRIKNYVFVIVGDGPLLEPMKKLASEYGIEDKFKFLPPKTQTELALFYASSDVIVFTHAGMTLVEAALSAKPIVAYDYEWHPEVIGKDERGYLAAFRDYEMLADKVAYVLENYDEAIARARKARTFALENFSKDHVTAIEKNVYEKYLKGQIQ